MIANYPRGHVYCLWGFIDIFFKVYCFNNIWTGRQKLYAHPTTLGPSFYAPQNTWWFPFSFPLPLSTSHSHGPVLQKVRSVANLIYSFFFFFFKTWLILSMCERSSPLKVLHLYHACSWLSGLADLLLELYQRGNTALCTLLSARCGVDRPAQLESQVDQFHILKGDGDCRLPVTLRVHQS